jgi:hypothetical protein
MANSTNQIDQISFSPTSVLFDAGAFDRSITTHGVLMIHWAAQPCPVGKIDENSVRRPHPDHSSCSNGMIYTKAGRVRCLFINSSNKMDQWDTGLADGSTVTETTPRTYDDSDNEIQVVPFDRFFIDEESLLVPHTQLVEAHISGHDRLSFPVVKVVNIIDAKGITYCPEDYTIENGQIVWTGPNQPGYNPLIQKGTIYSIRYLYRPFFYVDRVAHQTRQITVDTGLESKNVRGPQEFTLIREKVFLKEEKDDQAANPDSPRQVKGPRAGPLAAR